MTIARPRLVVAINPRAAFGRRSTVGLRVVEALEADGHRVTAVQKSSFEELRSATARAIEGGVDALIVVGGDGMVSLGTGLVAETSVPLGIVPCGTGNDLARGLGLPLDDPAKAIRALQTALTRSARVIDAGRVRQGEVTSWFAGVVSAGFDAVVNERANRMRWPRGGSRYTLAILRELATFRPLEYELVVDGVASTTRAMLVSVANNRFLGGGMMIAPEARLDDGLLDLFVVTPLSRPRFLRLFPRVFSGTHTTFPEVHLSRVRSVRLSAVGVAAYADGERLGPLPVEVDIVPGALRVLV